MPQFDLAFFIGEAFWMLVCFGVFYALIRFLVYPLFQDVFSEREHKIQNDLAVAEAINEQAAKLIQTYKGRIFSAQQTKAEIINETYRDIQKYSAHIDAQHEQQFKKQIEEAEQKMRRVKKSVLEKSDMIALSIAEEFVKKIAGKSYSAK